MWPLSPLMTSHSKKCAFGKMSLGLRKIVDSGTSWPKSVFPTPDPPMTSHSEKYPFGELFLGLGKISWSALIYRLWDWRNFEISHSGDSPPLLVLGAFQISTDRQTCWFGRNFSLPNQHKLSDLLILYKLWDLEKFRAFPHYRGSKTWNNLELSSSLERSGQEI